MAKKGKKRASSKVKKNVAIKLTPKEQILEYRIKLAQDELDELNFKKNKIEQEIKLNENRNSALSIERDQYIDLCISKLKHDPLKDENTTTKEEVIKELLALWDFKAAQENLNVNIHEKIQETENKIESIHIEIDTWQNFATSGLKKLEARKNGLKLELQEMKENFSAMTKLLNEKFITDREKNEQETHQEVGLKRIKAFEQALEILNKDNVEDMKDNIWLNKEISLHKQELERLNKLLSGIEVENLKLTRGEILVNSEHLFISNKIFNNQVIPGEDLSKRNIFSTDLWNFFEQEMKYNKDTVLKNSIETDRKIDSSYNAILLNIGKLPEINEFMDLGRLELKLLSLNGNSLPVYDPETRSEEELNFTRNVNPWDLPYPTKDEFLERLKAPQNLEY